MFETQLGPAGEAVMAGRLVATRCGEVPGITLVNARPQNRDLSRDPGIARIIDMSRAPG